MRGRDTEAEDAHEEMFIVLDHPDVGSSKLVHLCLTVIGAVGGCIHELLTGARIVLHRAASSAAIDSHHQQTCDGKESDPTKPDFC